MPSIWRFLRNMFPPRSYSQQPSWVDPETARVIDALRRGERSNGVGLASHDDDDTPPTKPVR